MKKKKPYKYNSKSRLTPNSQSFPFKVNTIKNDVKTNLENTLTKLRIIEEPVEEKESLDDSFLEGRFDKKEEKKRKKKEKKPVVVIFLYYITQKLQRYYVYNWYNFYPYIN